MLEKEIEQNNILANKFISSIIKNSKVNEPDNYIDIEEDQASDEKYEYITYKDKEYILEGVELTENILEKEFGNEKNKLVIQPLGIAVMDFLIKNFNVLFNYDFTKNMEKELDNIA